jgi:hypothetical protein
MLDAGIPMPAASASMPMPRNDFKKPLQQPHSKFMMENRLLIFAARSLYTKTIDICCAVS